MINVLQSSSERIMTLENKVEVLEDLIEHYQTKLEHTEERVRYLIAMLEQRTDSCLLYTSPSPRD